MIGNDNLALIIVAIIGFFGLFVTPLVQLWTQLYVRKHLGKTNGSGSVSEMVEKQGKRLDRNDVMLEMICGFLGLVTPPPVGEEVDDKENHVPPQLDQPHSHREGRH